MVSSSSSSVFSPVVRVVVVLVSLSPSATRAVCSLSVPVVAVQVRLERVVRAVRAARVDPVGVAVVRRVPVRVRQQWRLR